MAVNNTEITNALTGYYSQPGRHLTQVFDNPVFNKMSLAEQAAFLEANKNSFQAPITLNKKTFVPAGIVGSAVLASSLAGGYANHVGSMAATPQGRAALADIIGRSFPNVSVEHIAQALGNPQHSRIMAFNLGVLRSELPNYLGARNVLAATGIAALATLPLILPPLYKTMLLRKRQKAIETASSPINGLVSAPISTSAFSPQNPLVAMALQKIQLLKPTL